MNSRHAIDKFSALAAIIIIAAILFPMPAVALGPVFEIRARDGTYVTGDPARRFAGLMDPENSVRVGIKLRSGLWVGYSSRHGLAMVFEY